MVAVVVRGSAGMARRLLRRVIQLIRLRKRWSSTHEGRRSSTNCKNGRGEGTSAVVKRLLSSEIASWPWNESTRVQVQGAGRVDGAGRAVEHDGTRSSSSLVWNRRSASPSTSAVWRTAPSQSHLRGERVERAVAAQTKDTDRAILARTFTPPLSSRLVPLVLPSRSYTYEHLTITMSAVRPSVPHSLSPTADPPRASRRTSSTSCACPPPPLLLSPNPTHPQCR